MLNIDLTGKRAFVAGVADDAGYGFAIAKALAEAGASVTVGTWPPALSIFRRLIERGSIDESLTLSNGSKMQFEGIYPLDAAFSTMDEVPEETLNNKRYQDLGDYSIAGVTEQLVKDYGDKPIDILVHSLANGPEVKKPLLETSRPGYLSAVSVSAYSLVAMTQHFGPLLRDGGSIVSLTYMASVRVVPGYGGGMSSSKAALESDTRTLSYEAGRKFGIRINCISAGPLLSRAARAIGGVDKMVDYTAINSPLTGEMQAEYVGNAATFLCSPLAEGITGQVIYVDRGYNIMGMPAATS